MRALESAAERAAGAAPQVLVQTDTFFRVPSGRLKLREIDGASAELIHYRRDDRPGPRSCEYSIVPVADPAAMKSLLSAALGVRAVVRKRRRLYLVGQSRIHLDDVEGLGRFVEIEVVMKPGQTREAATQIVRDLAASLDIRDSDLVACAYVDLLAGSQ